MGQHSKESNQSVKELGVFRRLWASEEAAFRAHLMRLPAEARRNRFAMGVSDAFIDGYAQRSFGYENVLTGWFVDGELRAAGELRPVNPSRLLGIGGDMEAAFSVEPQWQGHGVGSELMRLVIRAAQTRSCKTLYLSFLTGNQPMRKLALKFDAHIEMDRGDAHGEIDPGQALPVSFWQEGFRDAASFAIAALDVQRRRLKADSAGQQH
ncbi:MAG: GNAT family N-acetyltransferase [Alphaproteobacteria bacterium]|nr:GNAT family N-acetyltransferase [Alphaproteobacteria bacterium]